MSAPTSPARERFRLADRILRRARRFEKIEVSPEWPLLLAMPGRLLEAALRMGWDRLQYGHCGHVCAFDRIYSRVTGKRRQAGA